MIDERHLFKEVGQKIRQLREAQTGGRARLTQASGPKVPERSWCGCDAVPYEIRATPES